MPWKSLVLTVFCGMLLCSCTDRGGNITSQAPEEGGAAPDHASEEAAEYGPLSPLSPGPVAHVDGARLGPPVKFSSEMEEITCHEFFMDGQGVGWIYAGYRTGAGLVLFRCEEYGDDPSTEPGAVYGGLDEKLYELVRGDGIWKLRQIPLPRYGFISNPDICGNRVAYWGYEGQEYFVSVFDLGKREILREVKFGEFDLGTDDPWYFPFPEWKESCGEVRFPANKELKEDMTFVFD